MVERFRLRIEDEVYQVEVGDGVVWINGQPFSVKVDKGKVIVEGASHEVELRADVVVVNGIAYKYEILEEKPETQAVALPEAPVEEGGLVKAIMPGKIIAVKVQKGSRVKKGDVLCILEAMKMENEVHAPRDGIVREVMVSEGDDVEMNQVLVIIE
ncbi:MAG: biotin/lipoyl-containing protein [Anaerolineae bacterium]|nr:biotin/lipoyl-binding protein [Anaerolineae bacterium]MDW8102767.1 biotin/lipoyl-containing protein [Anaerolineae bacterium]